MSPTSRPILVVFHAGVDPVSSTLEQLVSRVGGAATLDLLSHAGETGGFAGALLVTADAEFAGDAARAATLPLTVELDRPGEFHFGEELRRVCRTHSIERVVYVGGGSMPLATAEALSGLASAASGEPCVVSNNLFSADVVAFYPASALDRIALPATDNDLAWLLHYRGGLPNASAVRSLATGFDIDTPVDVAALWLATRSAPLDRVPGRALAAELETVPTALPVLCDALTRAYEVMSTRRAQVFLAGRVSSWTWRRLEANLPCQTRVLSEERGMRAGGREARGEVRSLLGLYLDAAGTGGLFSAIEETSDAAFMDTRVLFAHRRVTLSKAERFASDALLPELISNPWAAELTERAAQMRVPVILGGHSLVSGGVWAISERVRGSASSAAS